MVQKTQALICGAGPAGLASAMMLHRQGWQDIVVLERRQNRDAFDRSKAFNYQLDGRGQRMLALIGIDENMIQDFGVANKKSIFTNFTPNGEEKTITVPFVLEDKQTAYWVTRQALLDLLLQHLERTNTDSRIRLLFDHSFDSIDVSEDNIVATAIKGDVEKNVFHPQLILGCDGLNSNLRESLDANSKSPKDAFKMIAKPSPSSNLLYKVIQFPTDIVVNGKQNLLGNHRMSYIFSSTYKNLDERLSLFSLPIARPTEVRTANIILPSDHKLWTIDTKHDLLAYLKVGFPQLDIDKIFPEEELEEFVTLRPGKFPDPQYSPSLYSEFKSKDSSTICVLLGDAAHSFPPDLGLGVNSALEDVYLLSQKLENTNQKISDGVAQYEIERLPESRALVRLVGKVFPYQYNQIPWRFNLSMVKFLIQLGISKITGGLIDQPAFRLTQNDRLTYQAIEQRMVITDAIFYIIVIGIPIALCAVAFYN